MGFWDNAMQACGVTRGSFQKTAPTPYELRPVFAPGGVGVRNQAVRRPFAPPLDSVTGRGGFCVLRTLDTQRPMFYVGAQSKRINDVLVNSSGNNYLPDLISLYNPDANVQGPQF